MRENSREWPWPIDSMVLFGGDYNPEQWLESPEILEEDLRLMEKAGISVVSLGIFSWSFLEPEEGHFSFSWLDSVMDNLHRHGIRVFLATPSGARPGWMAAKYPEVLRVAPDGKRNLFGGRHNHCFSSPVYREKVGIMNRELALRYGDHPAVVLWHISNEYSGECHCELCQENFRAWLKERYGSLEALNRAWWSAFWSHTFSDWSEIHSPVPHGEQTLHGLTLDWKRFVTHMTVDFLDHEVSTLRAAGSLLPVTTNMMTSSNDLEKDPGLDYWKFRGHMDIASWDSYPAWHLPGHDSLYLEDSDAPVDDYRRASEEAFQHDLFRCLGGGRFLLMESTPSNVNWQLRSKIKKPGMIALSGLHAVSHGAASVQYFQWRKSRGSYEKYHGAFVDHDAVGAYEHRVFRECSDLGALLQGLGEAEGFAASEYPAEAAILYNWENRWAIEEGRDVVNGPAKGYFPTVKRHYYSLWSRGIGMDVISGDEEWEYFASKKVIVAPMLYLVTDSLAGKLARYVREGGTLLCTYMSGRVGESDLCHPGGAPGPLSELLGLRVEETDALYPGEAVEVVFEPELSAEAGAGAASAASAAGAARAQVAIVVPGTPGTAGLSAAAGLPGGFRVRDYQDVIHPGTARVLARFRGGLAEGKPAVTVNRCGKGSAWYLGGRLDLPALSVLHGMICREAELSSAHDGMVRRDPWIDIQRRRCGEREFLFVMNFSDRPGIAEWVDPLRELSAGDGSGAGLSKRWVLPAWGVKVLFRE
jgi:beta-galactosidase